MTWMRGVGALLLAAGLLWLACAAVLVALGWRSRWGFHPGLLPDGLLGGAGVALVGLLLWEAS